MEPKLLTAERFVDTEIGCSYRYVHSSTEYFRPHYHDYYEIFIPLSGHALHIVNGAEIPLTVGTAVFIRPSDTHDYICQGDKGFEMLNITFTEGTVNDMFVYLGNTAGLSLLLTPALPPTVALSESDTELINSEMTYIRLIDTDREKLRSALRCLLLRLVSEHFLRSPSDETANIPQWLRELRERIKEDNNFVEGTSSVSRLSDKSREHISRSMKKYYGVTVSEYVNDLRLNYIANMLVYSNHDILDIVFESGFNNVSWCYKCFAKKYGMSMAKYRNAAYRD